MAYETVAVLAVDDFSTDHTQDPAWWVWKGNRSGELAPVVVDGQLTIPHIDSDGSGFPGDIAFGKFTEGGSDQMAQRTTVKFSKSALDQWIYVAVRMRDSPNVMGGTFEQLTGYAGPNGSVMVQSDGGTLLEGGSVEFELGSWYWLRTTIDETHNMNVELFDFDPYAGGFSIVSVSSDLPDDPDEFRLTPGVGGIITISGVVIDEVRYEVPTAPEPPPDDEYYYVGTSILTATKKMLGVTPEDHAFDHDIITGINSAFGTLEQMGIGANGFAIEDETPEWSDFSEPFPQFNLIKSFVYLHVRLFFDPPATTFHLNAVQEQLKELTWRLSVSREGTDWVDPNPVVPDVEPA